MNALGVTLIGGNVLTPVHAAILLQQCQVGSQVRCHHASGTQLCKDNACICAVNFESHLWVQSFHIHTEANRSPIRPQPALRSRQCFPVTSPGHLSRYLATTMELSHTAG